MLQTWVLVATRNLWERLPLAAKDVAKDNKR
jgi:hypothetical protein